MSGEQQESGFALRGKSQRPLIHMVVRLRLADRMVLGDIGKNKQKIRFQQIQRILQSLVYIQDVRYRAFAHSVKRKFATKGDKVCSTRKINTVSITFLMFWCVVSLYITTVHYDFYELSYILTTSRVSRKIIQTTS